MWFVVLVGDKGHRCRLSDMKEKGFVLHMKPHHPQYFLDETEFVKE